MKSLEKLQTAIKAINFKNEDGSLDVALNLLHEFMVDNESKQKRTTIKDFRAKEKYRPAMCGIFHDADDKVAVATDGHVLLVSKSDYNEDFAGKTVDEYGNEIESKIPKYKSVLPCSLDNYQSYPLSAEDVRKGLNELKAFAKQNKIDKNFYATHLESNVSFDPELLIKFADFSDGEIQLCGVTRPALHYGEDSKVLCMPKFFDYIEQFSVTINGWIFRAV